MIPRSILSLLLLALPATAPAQPKDAPLAPNLPVRHLKGSDGWDVKDLKADLKSLALYEKAASSWHAAGGTDAKTKGEIVSGAALSDALIADVLEALKSIKPNGGLGAFYHASFMCAAGEGESALRAAEACYLHNALRHLEVMIDVAESGKPDPKPKQWFDDAMKGLAAVREKLKSGGFGVGGAADDERRKKDAAAVEEAKKRAEVRIDRPWYDFWSDDSPPGSSQIFGTPKGQSLGHILSEGSAFATGLPGNQIPKGLNTRLDGGRVPSPTVSALAASGDLLTESLLNPSLYLVPGLGGAMRLLGKPTVAGTDASSKKPSALYSYGAFFGTAEPIFGGAPGAVIKTRVVTTQDKRASVDAYTLALEQLKAGRKGDAVTSLKSALERDPGNADARAKLQELESSK